MEWQSYIDGCGCGRANASTEEEEKNEKTNTTVKISPSSPLTLRRGDSTYMICYCATCTDSTVPLQARPHRRGRIRYVPEWAESSSTN